MFGNIEGRRKRLRVVNRIGWKKKKREGKGIDIRT